MPHGHSFYFLLMLYPFLKWCPNKECVCILRVIFTKLHEVATLKEIISQNDYLSSKTYVFEDK